MWLVLLVEAQKYAEDVKSTDLDPQADSEEEEQGAE